MKGEVVGKSWPSGGVQACRGRGRHREEALGMQGAKQRRFGQQAAHERRAQKRGRLAPVAGKRAGQLARLPSQVGVGYTLVVQAVSRAAAAHSRQAGRLAAAAAVSHGSVEQAAIGRGLVVKAGVQAAPRRHRGSLRVRRRRRRRAAPRRLSLVAPQPSQEHHGGRGCRRRRRRVLLFWLPLVFFAVAVTTVAAAVASGRVGRRRQRRSSRDGHRRRRRRAHVRAAARHRRLALAGVLHECVEG
mgnify:CR=1 FL=1